MTLSAEALDLSRCSTEQALQRICEARHRWPNEIAPGCNPAVLNLIAVAIDEVARNTLHGDGGVVHRLPIGDDSVLIITTDYDGEDHLVQTGQSKGIELLEGILGKENVVIQHNKGVFECYVRLHPPTIACQLAAVA